MTQISPLNFTTRSMPLKNKEVVNEQPIHTNLSIPKSMVLATPNSRLMHVYFAGRVEEEIKIQGHPKLQKFIDWALNAAKISNEKAAAHEPDGWQIYIPEIIKVQQPTGRRKVESNQTIRLFNKTFEGFTWTGEECSDPTVKVDGYDKRWDSLKLIDLYNPDVRKRHIEELKKLGISNIRLGIQMSKTSESHNDFVNAVNDYHDSGLKVALDLQHFGLPDSLKNYEHSEKSDYLNPKMPEVYRKYVKDNIDKYYDKVDALTIINEPLVTNKLSGVFWNECAPGNEGHPDFKRLFINRALNMAKAAVSGRIEIEKYAQDNNKPEKVFIHNESCEHQPWNDDFNNHIRFLGSDLILGQDWLIKGKFDKVESYSPEILKDKPEMFKWMAENSVNREYKNENGEVIHDSKTINELQTKDYNNLMDDLSQVKKLHKKLNHVTKTPKNPNGKTMKSNTVFGLDYYVACEYGPKLCQDFRYYKDEINEGSRQGLYKIGSDLYNRYQMPFLHTETNLHPELGDKWALQSCVEMAQLAKSGVPVLGFNWYSLIDQYGWGRGLNVDPDKAKDHLWPVGLLSPEFERRPAADFMEGLGKATK